MWIICYRNTYLLYRKILNLKSSFYSFLNRILHLYLIFWIQTRFNDWTTNILNFILLHHGLVLCIWGICIAFIGLTIPIKWRDQYFFDLQKNYLKCLLFCLRSFMVFLNSINFNCYYDFLIVLCKVPNHSLAHLSLN